ncbi:heparan-alpha-glucosaminide N-acetyltransferase [Roseibium sp.]|uniref:heparan-alpha-glucosaminide N-acetyltransferase n=1 Tax=Roseibium sp. TaxID=1936156 RepID=UPI003D128ECA
MPYSRLAVLDFARGLAVVAMALYHLSWDLSWFGFVDWPVAHGSGWRVFAALIAGSFLFLAGVSLDLAHHKGIRWRPFRRRLAVIVVAAAAVSLVTYFTFGNTYVRFGILHSIAAASVIALPFTRLPFWVGAAGAVFLLSLPAWAGSPVFNGQLWLWTGLGTPEFASVDYVPVAPWAGVTLAGLSASRIFRGAHVWEKLAVFRLDGRAGRISRFLGRHSLPVYLLHQPVLYGLVWSATLLGPGADPAGAAFVRNCTAACQVNLGNEVSCEAACSCTLKHLKAGRIWTALNSDPTDQTLRLQMNDAYAQCLADPALVPGQSD